MSEQSRQTIPLSESWRGLEQLASQRILVLDGAMGTMIQRLGLDEAGFRGAPFVDHASDLKGCNDLLSLTQPDAITAIHRAYLEAGADIVCTNTFNANRISLADYGLTDHVREINLAAARCARRAVEEYERQRGSMGERETGPDATVPANGPAAESPPLPLTLSSPLFIAGSIGPTNRTASLSPDVSDPGYRAVTFDDLAAAYYEQIVRVGRRRRGHPPGRDGLRYAQPEGLPVRHRGLFPASMAGACP